MSIAKKNQFNKSLQGFLAKQKNVDAEALLEWELACNTSPKCGHIYNQKELFNLYDRFGQSQGASKACHLINHEGDDFKYIILKRHLEWGYIPDVSREHNACTGNQLLDEINCWERLAGTEEADLLCPILKYFKSKSDKVTSTSETMQHNIIIISQRAEYVGDARECCLKAEKLNLEQNLNGESRFSRLAKLEQLSVKMGWRDALYNCGNSGVIFDYSQNCYKAVFIDYAL